MYTAAPAGAAMSPFSRKLRFHARALTSDAKNLQVAAGGNFAWKIYVRNFPCPRGDSLGDTTSPEFILRHGISEGKIQRVRKMRVFQACFEPLPSPGFVYSLLLQNPRFENIPHERDPLLWRRITYCCSKSAQALLWDIISPLGAYVSCRSLTSSDFTDHVFHT